MSKKSMYSAYVIEVHKLMKHEGIAKKTACRKIAQKHDLSVGGFYKFIADIKDLEDYCDEVDVIDDGDILTEQTETKEELRFNIYSSFKQTVDDVIDYHQVDMDVFEIKEVLTNYIEQGQKLRALKTVKDGKPTVIHRTNKVPLHQIKVIFKRKASLFNPERFIEGIKEAFKPAIKQKPKKHKPSKKKNLLVEPFIVDHHIGNCIQGDNFEMLYDIDIARKFYEGAIDDFLSRIDLDRVARFLLPSGNDLVHFDNFGNKTTRGTQLFGNAQEYERSCVVAEVMSIEVIKRLSVIAPVDVPVIKSNHAYNTEFHIGRSLMYCFESNPNVQVFNSTRSRQYYRHKGVAIGFCHGHNEKIHELHNIFPIERPDLWHECHTKHFHIAHRHYFTKTKSLAKVQEQANQKGLTVIQGSTMCFPDAWHLDKGYIGNEVRTQCFVFDENNHIDTLYYYPT